MIKCPECNPQLLSAITSSIDRLQLDVIFLEKSLPIRNPGGDRQLFIDRKIRQGRGELAKLKRMTTFTCLEFQKNNKFVTLDKSLAALAQSCK
jgi:hypothetical protein